MREAVYHGNVLSLREQVPLAPLTTLGVGGPARFFTEASTVEDLREAVQHARKAGLPLFVLGGGSNLVIADSGFAGLVVRMKIAGVTQADQQGRVLFEAGAGEDWDGFVAKTVGANCGGIECLSGIPGTVGGTPVQNVGAYGQEVSETIVHVVVFHRESAQVQTFTNAECGFSYRTSRFNSRERDKFVVLQVAYSLEKNAAPKVKYADLQKYFADRPAPSLQELRDAVREIRQRKGMLLVEGDPDVRSAGSFFKNPIVAAAKFRELEGTMQARGLQIPNYPADAGQVKLSAAWLVEKAGFHKGYQQGNVGISSKHSLAIVNRGGAKAADVVSLMQRVQEGVLAQFDVELHPEPVFVGFESSAATR